METEGLVEFEIIINDLLSSFRFIWVGLPLPKDGPRGEMVRVKINVKPEFTVT